MRKILIGLLFISTQVFAAEKLGQITEDITYICIVNEDTKLFNDVFVAELKVNGPNKLSYQRQSVGGRGHLKLVPGCANMLPDPMKHWPEAIHFACDDDGEQGFFQVLPETGEGEIYFYMPKLGYGERTSLTLSCTAQ